jgi:hypothetical protein
LPERNAYVKTLRDTEAILAAATAFPALAPYVEQRLKELAEYDEDLSVVINIFVVEPADSLSDLVHALGFSPEERAAEVIEDHPAAYELTYVLSDDGFGFVVYVPKTPDMDRDLLQLLAHEFDRRRTP